MDLLVETFSQSFMQRVLIGGLLAVVATSLVGTWVVLRGLAFLGDALAHGVIPGVAVALLIGIHPAVGAIVAAAIMAGLVSLVSSRSTIRDDTGIGLLFVGMLSLGIVIVSRARSFSTEVTALLFGDVLGVSRSDIWVQLAATAAVIVATVVLYRPFLALTFNPLKARSLGLHPQASHLAMMMLVALSIVASFQTVGTLLVFGLLVGPPATAGLLTRRVPTMMLLSVVFGSVSVVAGLTISYHYSTAGGPTMSGLSVVFFFVVLGLVELRQALVEVDDEPPLH